MWTVSYSGVNVISADFYFFANILIFLTELSIIGKDIKNTINEGRVTDLRKLIVRHQELHNDIVINPLQFLLHIHSRSCFNKFL